MERDAPEHSFIGRQVSHYNIVGRLGAGGMGVVYKAIDLNLDRSVALKFLPPQFCYEERLKERFVQEAKAASALDHNNIGIIHGIEETGDGQMFIVMAFYDGETLSAKIQRGALPLGQAIDFATQIAKGLHSAHRKDIVHRDIKPSNVIVTTQGVAKIVDFGLARLAGGIGMTQPGSTLGTAAYMSPEQAQGHVVDQRTDIWALGVVLFEMLTGALPFGGSNVHTVLNAIISSPTPDLPRWVPANLNGIVRRALSKDLTKRYATAEEMAIDLAALEQSLSTDERTQTVVIEPDHSSGARFGSTGGRESWLAASRFGRRLRLRTAVASVIVLLLLSPAVFLSSHARQRLAIMLTGGRPSVRRLVVLPFNNAGNDPANVALCDGLAEVLASKLTSLDTVQNTLSVVPASEVRRRKVSSPGDARREFRADLVVTGSVQRDSSGVSLNVNLVDAADVRQIGSAVVHAPSGSLFAIQDEAIAKLAILLNVNLRLPPNQLSAPDAPSVPSVYEAYLKGVGLLQRYDKPANLDGAIALFGQTIKDDPKFALAYAKLGEAYQLKYRIAKDPRALSLAQENSKLALGLNSQLPTPYVTLGFVHEGSGHHDLAVQEFQRALQLDERNVQAYQGLARAYESLGRAKEAEGMYQKAVDLNPDAWEGYSRLGAFYNRQGRYREALDQFRRVVNIAPDNSLGFLNVGALLFRTGKPQEAAEMYRKSLALAPSYIAYSNLGGVYFQQGQFAEAVRMYEQALKMNEKDYQIWKNLAVSRKRLNGLNPTTLDTYERAGKAAEQFLGANPQDAEALADLADIRINLNRKEEAERLIRRATALAPSSPGVLLKAAEAYESLGARDQALHWLRAALEHGIPKETVMRETGLETLRHDPRFAETMARPSEAVQPSDANGTHR